MTVKAELRAQIGGNTRNLIKVLDRKTNYKRSKVSYKQSGGAIIINVTADDAVALLASLSSSLKQLRVVTSVDRIAAKLSAGRRS